MGEQEAARDLALGCIVVMLMLALFALAGTSDYQSELAYRDAFTGGESYAGD